MQPSEPLDILPLWALFLTIVVGSYVAVELGYRIGQYRKRLAETEKETTVGPVVAATLGLFAFLLAFTFSLAASRYDERRRMVVKEANAIGTTHLRAGLLSEPERSAIRELLDRYVGVRVEAVQTGDVARGISASTDLHRRIWTLAEAAAAKDSHSITAGLFIQALNETIDLHSERVLIGVHSRIPIIIWLALYLIAFFSMAELGYHEGIAGSRRSLAVAALVVSFATVMWLIADLDRQREGLIQVSQQAMIELRESWHAQQPESIPR
jgi:hypothetical protein